MVCPQWLRPFPCSPAVFTAPLPTDPGGAVCLAVALFAFPSRAVILSFVAFCYLWRNVWSFARCLLGPFGAFCCCCRSSLYILDFVALLFPNICTPVPQVPPTHTHPQPDVLVSVALRRGLFLLSVESHAPWTPVGALLPPFCWRALLFASVCRQTSETIRQAQKLPDSDRNYFHGFKFSCSCL